MAPKKSNLQDPRVGARRSKKRKHCAKNPRLADVENRLNQYPRLCNPNNKPGSDQQLRELQEQYIKLHDDYKSKLFEIACLRADKEKYTKNAENQIADLESQLALQKSSEQEFLEDMLQEIEKERGIK